MSHRGSDEFVWALSEKDGKEIWAVKIAPAYTQNWPQSKEGPSCTPTVDGDRIYVMGLAGNVACLQAADGKVIWQRSLKSDFGGRSTTLDSQSFYSRLNAPSSAENRSSNVPIKR